MRRIVWKRSQKGSGAKGCRKKENQPKRRRITRKMSPKKRKVTSILTKK